MSKKERKIEITLDDVTRDNQQVTSVKVGEEEIGTVSENPTRKRFEAQVNGSNQVIKTKSHDEAVNELLKEYHLHRG